MGLERIRVGVTIVVAIPPSLKRHAIFTYREAIL
tara:strand:- start:331 stop:432 length:102 start_codon:yes stop_codon:yes gene_type:complete